MIKKKVVKYLTILSFLLSTSFGIAKESSNLYIGVICGFGQSINKNIQYQYEYNVLNSYNPKEIDKENSVDYKIGLNMEYKLFSSGNICNSISLNLDIRNSILENHVSGSKILQYFEDPSDLKDSVLVVSSTQLQEKMNFNFLNLDFLYRVRFNSFIRYGLELGPFISIPIKAKSYEEYKIVEPILTQFPLVQGYKYNDNYRTVVLYEGNIKNLNPFYWGIKTNLFIEYEFLDFIKTTAEVGYSYPLSNIVKNSDWKIESYYANLVLSIKLNDFFNRNKERK